MYRSSTNVYMYLSLWYSAQKMGRKRLVMNLDEVEHAALMKKARAGGDTLSNFVRKALGLQPVRQGIKAPAVKTRHAKVKAE
jgi:hypothetical protein